MEIPHFGSMRGKERELIVLRSDNGDTWKEHQSEVRTEDLTDLLAGMDEGLFIWFILKGFPLVFTMGRLVSPESEQKQISKQMKMPKFLR